MKRLIFAISMAAAILLPGCGSDPAGPSGDGWSEVTVDGITLAWLPTDSTISVEVTGPTTGWVAVGFDPTTGMQDANIVIGCWSGTDAILRDDWGNTPSSHRADTLLGGTHDLLDISAKEASGATTIGFTIPLVTGDAFDKPLFIDSTYTVILAYAPDGVDDFSSQHEVFTTTSITLTLP